MGLAHREGELEQHALGIVVEEDAQLHEGLAHRRRCDGGDCPGDGASRHLHVPVIQGPFGAVLAAEHVLLVGSMHHHLRAGNDAGFPVQRNGDAVHQVVVLVGGKELA